MKHTLFAFFCILSVGMNAFVAGVPVRPRPRPRKLSIDGISSKTSKEMVATLKELQMQIHNSKESDPNLRDWLSDLIWAILGYTVGVFLTIVNNAVVEFANLIDVGVKELYTLIDSADEATKQEITEVITKALDQTTELIMSLLAELGCVLPSLSSIGGEESMKAPTDASDIIRSILGMSLEDFLLKITSVLEESDELLVKTIASLKSIAERINEPSLADDLNAISDQYMNMGRAAIRPILDSLYQVLPPEQE